MKITAALFVSLVWLVQPVASQQQLNVACVGNSITYGAGISTRPEDAYPQQLQKLLGDAYQVENFGNSGRTLLKNGDNPFWVEPEFKAAIDMQPDIVIILLGTNDSKPQNWVYKNEYIPDYIAMIDTFRAVNPETQIYACLPPPAFSVQWGIRDSIITTDIIPMIQKIVDSTKVQIIDFYSPFVDRNELFPDDIHPDIDGSWEMAKVVYTTLTGKTVSTMMDENMARQATLQTAKGSDVTALNLIDGDCLTLWDCSANDWAVLDLGDEIEIDLFQLYFPHDDSYPQLPYSIDVSTDSTHWSRVVETSSDSALVSIKSIDPVSARYVKLSMSGSENSSSAIADFRVLKAAPLHAPAFYIDDIKPASRYTRYTYYVQPSQESGYVKVLRSNNLDEPFTALTGYRMAELQSSNGSLRQERVQRYTTMAFDQDVEVLSCDTLTIDWTISDILAHSDAKLPQYFELQNFPNPFNSQTQINYVLPHAGYVDVTVFNVNGQRMRNLVTAIKQAGYHSIVWDGNNDFGQNAPSGVYFCQLQLDGQLALLRRMVLLR